MTPLASTSTVRLASTSAGSGKYTSAIRKLTRSPTCGTALGFMFRYPHSRKAKWMPESRQADDQGTGYRKPFDLSDDRAGVDRGAQLETRHRAASLRQELAEDSELGRLVRCRDSRLMRREILAERGVGASAAGLQESAGHPAGHSGRLAQRINHCPARWTGTPFPSVRFRLGQGTRGAKRSFGVWLCGSGKSGSCAPR